MIVRVFNQPFGPKLMFLLLLQTNKQTERHLDDAVVSTLRPICRQEAHQNGPDAWTRRPARAGRARPVCVSGEELDECVTSLSCERLKRRDFCLRCGERISLCRKITFCLCVKRH